MAELTLFWHRRDLRLHDNSGLYKALKSGRPVQPVFIFDRKILDELEPRDARVVFIHRELDRLRQEYAKHGANLKVYYGNPTEVWEGIVQDFEVAEVWLNRDYEPYAISRDKDIFAFLESRGIALKGSKDHVVFEKDEVVKDDGKPYTVFTPYMKRWKAQLAAHPIERFPSETLLAQCFQAEVTELPTLGSMGFEDFDHPFPEPHVAKETLSRYSETRDIPSIQGTSRLSVHLRFGTVSIRECVLQGLAHSEKWLNELIWRDFYQMILYHFPHTVRQAFKPQYDRVEWINNESQFKAWCEGRTGYPIVDAGMRELNATGFMHNRVRMITASFLTKHLLIDWRWGERYFARKLLDFELASNVGGWQWAASSGCDAAPYFRVFNPSTQTVRFDPDERYIRRWVPEVHGSDYPQPIVEHKMARQRAIDRVKSAVSQSSS